MQSIAVNNLANNLDNKVIFLNNNLNSEVPQVEVVANIEQIETPTSEQPIDVAPAVKIPLKQKIKIFAIKVFKILKEKYCSESLVMGIDIRPNVIRVAISDEENGVWRVKNLYTKNIANTLNFENLEKNKNLYATALKQIISENKIKNKNVALAVPTSMAIIKNITMPLMSEENFKKATKINSFWQNLVQISDNLKDYSIFYRIARKLPASNEMEVLFVAAKTKDIKTYTDILNAAGLEVLVADISCFSLSNLAKLKDEVAADDKVHAIIKIGSDENFLQINDMGKPYIYDVFVPENEKMYVDEYIEHATFQTRFIAQVKHILTKHKESFGTEITEIEIISASPNISSFIDKMQEACEGVKISLSNLFEDIIFGKDVAQKLENNKFENQKNEWAIAIGLSTRKLKLFADKNDLNVSDKVNLAFDNQANTEKLKAKFISKIALSGLAIGFTILLLVLSIVFYAQYKIKVAEANKFNELNKIYIQKSADFKQITSDSATLMKLIKANESVGSNQDLLLTALKDLSGMIPDGVWLESVEFGKASEIKIIGRSLDEKNILKFSRLLDESSVIKNTYIDSMKITSAEAGSLSREFIIKGEIVRLNEAGAVVIKNEDAGGKK
jgi:Tfp pilus assembly protein PilN